jgi:hypothetical protein
MIPGTPVRTAVFITESPTPASTTLRSPLALT